MKYQIQKCYEIFDYSQQTYHLSKNKSMNLYLQSLYDNNLWNAKETIDLSKEIGNRYHICHISTKETVAGLREYR